MILNKIKDRVISPRTTLIESMKLMDSLGKKLLFVFDGNFFSGILTIGDIQRAIIKGISLSTESKFALDCNKIYASVHDSKEQIKEKMSRLRAECMPIMDDSGTMVDVVFWKDWFLKAEPEKREKIDLPVVIMAGGKGTRLKPITNVIPKPLIPIGDKTILEEIMDQFEHIGCKQFYMSVNYKSDMIRFYLDQLEHKYSIDFFEEAKPLGTIGSVSLLKGKINTPFFVSNCDIMIDQDYRDVYDYHKQNKNDLTIVTAVKSIRIPYGVIDTGDDGLMTGLREKPEITYMINTGVYLLNPGLIDEIPEGEFFHITHLMEKVKSRGGRVGCFPVSEGSWRDMGEWPEYLKMIKVL
ncbi:nucleotidyltransferase family protein [Fibrobacter succinogenes]|uniref:Nucleotidyl transferase n=1 Tax=Fibrobacter succinogenes TaxID=833 RepID=A0A380S876_FIBSU|nr:nucleotidyltransferase family protein [Fibrobacter succinogenes]PWJ34877.1 nucleotidyltransferase-like protein [Fibrobacter succinogenes subsp. elongatus]SUQ25000.1 Nucleotidyl transferase [Fibrobacter succinogenes]